MWAEQTFALSGDPAESEDALDQLRGYIADLIAHKRPHPAEDLLDELIAARDNDDRLGEEELVGFGVTLLLAGHETTANETGNIIYTLLANRRYCDELVTEPDLMPAAVEELLRITPLAASVSFPRFATEDLELGGQHISAGDAILVDMASGNRDEAVFDHPDEIDFHRDDVPHVAFGHGIHHCLGAQLARMEIQTAIAALVRRLPPCVSRWHQRQCRGEPTARSEAWPALPASWDMS